MGPRRKWSSRPFWRTSPWGRGGRAGGEVDGAVVLVNLDGVAAAEGDVGAAFATKMGEVVLAADARNPGAGVAAEISERSFCHRSQARSERRMSVALRR